MRQTFQVFCYHDSGRKRIEHFNSYFIHASFQRSSSGLLTLGALLAPFDTIHIEQIAETDDAQATYLQVSERFLPAIERDFGEGSQLVMVNKHTFTINVDGVVIS